MPHAHTHALSVAFHVRVFITDPDSCLWPLLISLTALMEMDHFPILAKVDHVYEGLADEQQGGNNALIHKAISQCSIKLAKFSQGLLSCYVSWNLGLWLNVLDMAF